MREDKIIISTKKMQGTPSNPRDSYLFRFRRLRTMDIKIEKGDISCKLSQTLNGYSLRTSFDPIKNLRFLELMCKDFHVIGAYSKLGYNSDEVVFHSYESKEKIIEKIYNCIEVAFFQ